MIKNGLQTVIIIAHRLSTIRDANKIVVIEKGQIVEQGTHDDLIELGGKYKKLIERQLAGVKADNLDEDTKDKDFDDVEILDRDNDKEQFQSFKSMHEILY